MVVNVIINHSYPSLFPVLLFFLIFRNPEATYYVICVRARVFVCVCVWMLLAVRVGCLYFDVHIYILIRLAEDWADYSREDHQSLKDSHSVAVHNFMDAQVNRLCACVCMCVYLCMCVRVRECICSHALTVQKK